MIILTPEMAKSWLDDDDCLPPGWPKEVWYQYPEAMDSIATGRTIVVDAQLNREVWAFVERFSDTPYYWQDARALIAKRNGTCNTTS